MTSLSVHHDRIRADGIELHVARAGSGPPIILLHGFPENWTSWRHQIPALAHAGYSVWALDLRGYNLSDRPKERAEYRLSHLVDDIAATVRATGEPKAHIVGHDWGGIIAWTFAGQYPDLLDKLAILNAPHMRIYLGKVRRPYQMLRSWYVLFFQFPFLPERAIAMRHFKAIRHTFTKSPARKGTFSEQDIDQYIRALSEPGALTAAINYYRANMRPAPLKLASSARSSSPTLVIWGERDPALSIHLLEGLDQVVADLSVHRIPSAGHWVQNEAPDEVNRVLISFLRKKCHVPGEGAK